MYWRPWDSWDGSSCRPALVSRYKGQLSISLQPSANFDAAGVGFISIWDCERKDPPIFRLEALPSEPQRVSIVSCRLLTPCGGWRARLCPQCGPRTTRICLRVKYGVELSYRQLRTYVFFLLAGSSHLVKTSIWSSLKLLPSGLRPSGPVA